MGKLRTKRKNLRKREKRRALAAVRAAIRQSDTNTSRWTPEAEELELMHNEEERQRVHEMWTRAVERADASFQRQQRILVERQRLIQAIRQSMASA